jgi:hypothetical protein
MKYEENILKYLDGSLSDSESAELLHALSVSPEKRVILEQHLQLKDMVTSAQKPFTVPAELEQAMSRKYPVIPMYSNELMVGATMAERSVITSFFARRSVRVGAAALLLLAFTSYLAVSSRDRTSISEGSNTSAASVTSSSTATEPSVGSVSREALSNTSNNISVAQPTTISASVHNTNTTIRTKNVGSSSNVHTSLREKNIAVANENAVKVDEAIHAISVDANSTDASFPTELALISSISTPRTEPSASIERNSIGEQRYLDPFAKHDDGSSGPFLLRFEGVLGSTYFRVSEGGSVQNTRIETSPLLGADWIVSPHFSLGIEGSSAGIAKVVPTQVYKASENITRSVTSNTIEASNDWFGRAMLRYTVNPYDQFRVETSVGGGVVFDGAATPLISASAAVTTSLTNRLGLSLGAAFAGTFSEVSSPVPTGAAPIANSAMPVGYIEENAPASTTLFSPSLTIRVGLRFKPW